MVQGLGFLSKKSWHTKNLSNQEKVWMAEQKKLAEEQKTKELAKQIQQEREREELDKIAGKKSTTIDRGIDWMYQNTAGASELAKEDEAKKQEEFLLGKEFVPDGAAAGDFDNGDQTQGIHNVMAQQQEPEQHDQHDEQPSTEGYYGPSVKDRNESFRMRMEDPMFAVSKQRHDILQKHEHTKELYDKVGGPVTLMRKGEEEEESRAKRKDRKRRHRDDDDDRKHRKKSDRKKHKKKSRRRRRRSRSRSPSTDSDSGRSDDYRRDRYHDDRRRRDNDEDYRRRDERHRSRSRDRDHRRDYDDDYGHDRDRRSSNRRRDRYDDYSPDRRHGRGGRDYDRRRSYRSDDEDDDYDRRRQSREGDDRKHSSQRRSSDYPSKPPPSSSNGGQAAEDSSRRPPEDSKYGLQGARKKQLNSSDLGPNQDLLRQKRQQKEAERQRIKELASTRRRRSGDERARAIQEMQQDAVRKEERARTVSNNRNKHDDEEEQLSGRSASFITEMTKATHGISDNSVSLSERLRQNRHTNQRSHESFM